MEKLLIYLAGLILLALAMLTGCADLGTTIEKSQLQTRAYQTRSFDTTDHKMVMKAVIDTLQDDGYIIKDASEGLGLLSAQKEDSQDSQLYGFGSDSDLNDLGTLITILFEDKHYKHDVHVNERAMIEASANISQFGKKIRVRVNFQKKMWNSKGMVKSVSAIDDMEFYQNFFIKVEKAVFLARQDV